MFTIRSNENEKAPELQTDWRPAVFRSSGSLRLAAAGLSGLLAAGTGAAPAYASSETGFDRTAMETPASFVEKTGADLSSVEKTRVKLSSGEGIGVELSSVEGTGAKLSSGEGTGAETSSGERTEEETGYSQAGEGIGFSGDWSEQEAIALVNWDLDEEALPPWQEETPPEVPEDLLPYFQEQTEQAVSAYAGSLPPQADMRKYSPRANELRRMVRQAAENLTGKESRKIQQLMRALGEAAGTQTLPEVLAALQGMPGIWRDRQIAAASAAAEKLPYLPAQMSAQGEAADDETGGAGSPGESGSSGENSSPGENGSSGENSSPGENGSSGGNGSQGESGSSGGNESTGVFSSFSRFLHKEKEIAAEETQEENPETNAPLSYEQYLNGKDLPVPHALYDFELRFPADPGKMETKSGHSLFPGLNHFYGTVVPPGIQASSQAPGETYNSEERASGSMNPAAADTLSIDSVRAGILSMPLSQEPESVTAAASEEPMTRRTVIIGDSRTVGMGMYVQPEGEVYWSAADSKGYSWMVSTGVPAVEKYIGNGTDVVILMGVNDLGNVERYVSYMNEKAAEWKKLGARTFFVSVNPVDDKRSPNAKNARIEKFNAYAQDHLEGVQYIDSYSRIRHSFGSPDGIHFSRATYQEIYRIIRFYLYRGWYEENGLRFWFDCGKPCTGWHYLEGSWQYMDGYGVRWICGSRVGDVFLIPYPEVEMLDPYKAILQN